jgi:5,10-methylenetetrahydromethanopterin reductase
LWMAPHLRRATRIGPAALNPYLVHPLEIASQSALVDVATGARAYLGLARGAWLDRLGVRQPRPVRALREAALLVKHVLARRPEPFCGQVFRCAEATTLQYELMRDSVPITIGTWGSRTARMAGEIADEIKIGGSANPAMVARLRPAVIEGTRRAGRAADAVGICVGAVTAVDEDRQAARTLARREVARYLAVVARLDPTVDPDWLAHFERGNLEIPDDVLDRVAFAGTPEDVIRQVQAVLEAGATRVEFGTPLGRDPRSALGLLGRRVLPAVGNQ